MTVIVALVLAGAGVPFLWQLIKVKVLKFAGNLAWLASVIVDISITCLVLWLFKEVGLLNLIAGTIIVFVVSRTVYDHVIQRFFGGP